LLSDGFWKRRFSADPGILGRSVTLNARAFTVVGVMPPGFKGLSEQHRRPAFGCRSRSTRRRRRWRAAANRGFWGAGAAQAGVTMAAAQAEMDGISKQLERAYPGYQRKARRRGQPARRRAVRLAAAVAADVDGGGRVRAADRVRERREPC